MYTCNNIINIREFYRHNGNMKLHCQIIAYPTTEITRKTGIRALAEQTHAHGFVSEEQRDTSHNRAHRARTRAYLLSRLNSRYKRVKFACRTHGYLSPAPVAFVIDVTNPSPRASAYEPRRKKNATLARFHRRSLSRETFAMRRRLREIYLRPRHVAPPLPLPPSVPRKPGLIG